MSWTSFFDCIYVVNLPRRTDRLLQIKQELEGHNIPYHVWDAFDHENGREGIYVTLRSILSHSLAWGFNKILIFEDDAKIIVPSDDFKRVMELAILELPSSWEMMYLGANLPEPNSVTEYSAHLLTTKRALSLHAVAYNRPAMEMILSLPKMLAIDSQIASFVHPRGRSFVTYPMLCTQREGYSDIEKRPTSYRVFLEDRYEKVVQHLNLNNDR